MLPVRPLPSRLRPVHRALFPAWALAIALAGCELAAPPEGTPAWLRIDTIVLEGDPASQGALTQGFSDAWVFVDDQSIGAYELPVVLPVLLREGSTITVTAGIKQNGFSNSRIAYPLLLPWSFSPAFGEGDTIPAVPRVRYAPDVAFHRLINFETSTPFEEVNGSVPMQVTSEDSVVLEGTRSAFIELEDGQIIDLRSETFPGAAFPLGPDTIPEDDSPVFLEMDYRCNQPFDVWLRTSPAPGSTQAPINEYLLTLAARPAGNKIYLGLTDKLGGLGLNGRYQIVFRGFKDPSVATGRIYLDNLKLVSR